MQPRQSSPIEKRIGTCDHTEHVRFDKLLLRKLRRVEKALGHELDYSSGVRCTHCNKQAGGVVNSAHITGKAADSIINNSTARFAILEAAFKVGFNRIGVYNRFIHLDTDNTKPARVLWLS